MPHCQSSIGCLSAWLLQHVQIVYLSVHSASCKHCAMKCISIARVSISRIAHSLCIRQYLPCIRRRSKCLWHSMGMACKNRCRRRSLKISYRREIVIKCIYSREQSLSCFLELDISQLIGLFKFCLSTWTLIGIASECIPESMNAYIIRTAFLLLTRSHKLILNHFNIWNSHTGQRLVPHVYTSGSSRCPVVSNSIFLGSSYFLRIRLSTWTLEGIVSECLPETKNAHIIRIPCFLMTYSHKVILIHI